MCSAVTHFLLCYDSVNSAEVCKSLLLYRLQVRAEGSDCCVSEHGSPVMKSWWEGLACLTDNTPLLWTHYSCFLHNSTQAGCCTSLQTAFPVNSKIQAYCTFSFSLCLSFFLFFLFKKKKKKPTRCAFNLCGFGVNNKQWHTWLKFHLLSYQPYLL